MIDRWTQFGFYIGLVLFIGTQAIRLIAPQLVSAEYAYHHGTTRLPIEPFIAAAVVLVLVRLTYKIIAGPRWRDRMIGVGGLLVIGGAFVATSLLLSTAQMYT